MVEDWSDPCSGAPFRKFPVEVDQLRNSYCPASSSDIWMIQHLDYILQLDTELDKQLHQLDKNDVEYILDIQMN